ncbi:uncharacterized protein LOC125780197 isoform X1 [Bactrocera dorsalis]|uniref:Uncharacterized protein LOC125780197 isoform X1 n=2 Tax=Bactrocera dorsalis TaxID=27457 RepID=A0ABM3K8Y9_BACDO|nr:uncharacterized protein LOC125780197 isoform X1 [Bactrocera dorsalis]
MSLLKKVLKIYIAIFQIKAKMDNSRKTGAAGGRGCKLSELDTLVLEVIGKESPTCDGIRPQENDGEDMSLQDLIGITLNESNDSNSPLVITEVTATKKEEKPVPMPESSRKRKRYMENGSSAHGEAEIKKLKMDEKVECQIENLKLQNKNFHLKNKALQIKILEQKCMGRKGAYTPLFF